jgi:hypothetical protein
MDASTTAFEARGAHAVGRHVRRRGRQHGRRRRADRLGKSTLAGLPGPAGRPGDGTVLLDGVDVRRLREGEVSGQAAFVPQGTFLFDDTVRGNITLDEPFGDDEVWAALRVAARRRVPAPAAPEGPQTRVGASGGRPSPGGQRAAASRWPAAVRPPAPPAVLDDAEQRRRTTAVEARIPTPCAAASRPSTVVVDRVPARATTALGRRGRAGLEQGRVLRAGASHRAAARPTVPGLRGPGARLRAGGGRA